MSKKTLKKFNLAKKQVYKYNIIRKPEKKLDVLELLNSIQMNDDSLNGKIDEYLHGKQNVDKKRLLHKIQFTINE